MKPEPTTLYPTDDCMIDGFSEDFPMCQLIRDESLGWPQDPELDTDPFSAKLGLDLDSFSVFEAANSPKEWNIKENAKEWNVKELTHVPETWQQFPRSPSPDTSLTPALAALEFPKGPMPEELDSQNYCQKMEEGQSPIRQQNFVIPYPQIGEEFAQNNSLPLPTDFPQYQQRAPQEGLGDGDVVTIGIYTRSERAAKIFRYRQKRARRNYTKRVLYNCRKRFADSRPRVGGRFVINENRVIKPKIFLKRGRPRKTAVPLVNYLASSSFIVE